MTAPALPGSTGPDRAPSTLRGRRKQRGYPDLKPGCLSTRVTLIRQWQAHVIAATNVVAIIRERKERGLMRH
jgi:hypothetical protein